MKVTHLGDALLRSRPSSILSFLAPSVLPSTKNYKPYQTLFSARQKHISQRRCLATETTRLQAASKAVGQKLDEDESSTLSFSHDQAQSHVEPPMSFSDLPPTLRPLGTPRDRGKSKLYKTPLPSDHDSKELEDDQGLTDLQRTVLAEDKRSKNYTTRRQGQFAEQMTFFSDPARDVMQNVNLNSLLVVKVPLPPPLRLDAFIGRSEPVESNRGMDLGRAIKRLEIKLAYNNVRKDFISQRFHERPGLKRKRLKSARWRKRFKEGFRAVINKVQDMRKRGW